MINRKQIESAIATLQTHESLFEPDVLHETVATLQQHCHSLSQAEAKQLALKGERKQVTVMFADISGFTAMSEKLDPETVRHLINACFEKLGLVISRYDGYIDKFIGDEIMALFGAPIAHENDPERALRTALDMMAALESFNQTHADKIPKPLALHFGINTGLVIAGGIGTKDRQDYSVMGDAVNLAARLEDLSEAGEILVGEDTYRLTAPLFEFEALGPVQVKGKENPVRVYRLLGATALRGQIRGIEGLVSPLVGRQAELVILDKALVHLQQGKGAVFSVLGDAGLGKSRLVAEIYESSQEKQIVWAKGQALSYGQSASYLIVRDLLCHLLGISLEDTDEAIDQVLRSTLLTCCPEQVAEIYPYLAYLLELPLDAPSAERVRFLEGQALHQQIHQSVQKFIAAKAEINPLILIWDDLHWVDPSSLNLLQTLIPLAHLHPILHLLIYRPQRNSSFWRFHETLQQAVELLDDERQCIELPPLTLEESCVLVRNLMGDDPETEALQRLIVHKAEGNPFFIEEVIRSLIDNETLIPIKGDTNCLTSTMHIADITIPDTLQGVITARIDQLDPETKRTLQVAAVIGRIFPQDILAEAISKLNPS